MHSKHSARHSFGFTNTQLNTAASAAGSYGGNRSSTSDAWVRRRLAGACFGSITAAPSLETELVMTVCPFVKFVSFSPGPPKRPIQKRPHMHRAILAPARHHPPQPILILRKPTA